MLPEHVGRRMQQNKKQRMKCMMATKLYLSIIQNEASGKLVNFFLEKTNARRATNQLIAYQRPLISRRHLRCVFTESLLMKGDSDSEEQVALTPIAWASCPHTLCVIQH